MNKAREKQLNCVKFKLEFRPVLCCTAVLRFDMFLSPLRCLLLRTRPALLSYKPEAPARALHLPRVARPSSLPSSPISPYIAQLRSAFARPPATTTRFFTSSSRAAGPRPYYRGGSSSGGYSRGGAGASGWRYKIDRLSPNTILYSIIGQSSSSSPLLRQPRTHFGLHADPTDNLQASTSPSSSCGNTDNRFCSSIGYIRRSLVFSIAR